MRQHENSTKKNLFVSDKRAVSVTVDHAISIFILLIVSGIFVGSVTSTFNDREDTVTEKELDRITEQVSNGLIQTDSMVQYGESNGEFTSDGGVETRVLTQSPLYQRGYTVTVGESGDSTVVTASSGDISVQKEINLENDVEDFGGSGLIVIGYDGNDLTLDSE